MPKDIKKTIFEQTETTIDTKTGEISEFKSTSVKVQEQEPNFVKLYLDCVLSFRDLSRSLNPILVEILKYMSYADNPDGGQMIFLNGEIKRRVATTLKLKIDRINKAITDFVRGDVFRRVANSTYQVNPNIFGKGDWKDIKKIRATFDFNTGSLEADLEFKELEGQVNE